MQKLFSLLSFLVLAFVLVFAPLAKGGNTVWAREIIIIAVMLACLLQAWVTRERKPGLWWLPWFTLTVFIALQLSGLFGGRAFYTAMPLQTVAYWAIFSAYWALAWLVSSLSLQNIRWLATVLVLLVCLQAMYGLVAFLGGQETILGLWEKEYYLQDVTGTFVNRNHFAGYLALLWGIGLSYFFAYENKAGVRPAVVLRVGLAVLYSLVLIIALLGSHSRLGMIAGLLSFGSWIYFYVSRGQADSKWGKPVLIGLVLVLLFGMVWFGMGKLILRFAHLSLDERYFVWGALLDLPVGSWLFGIGAGGFEDFFRTITPISIQGDSVFREAHNDWLEFALDFGLIGAGCIVAAFIFWFTKLRPSRWSLIQYGALSGILAIAIHSLGDFNLQIPGVAVTFWVAVGILMNPHISQSEVDKAKREQRLREMGRSGKRRRVRRSSY